MTVVQTVNNTRYFFHVADRKFCQFGFDDEGVMCVVFDAFDGAGNPLDAITIRPFRTVQAIVSTEGTGEPTTIGHIEPERTGGTE